MMDVYLLLGGNQQPSPDFFEQVVHKLENSIGMVKKSSQLFWTKPWGFEAPTDFLNQVVIFSSFLTPQQILNTILDIEHYFGRERKQEGYESRRIDIDILFYDNLVLDTPELTIPHPRLHKRNFALVPLHDIAPHFVHPAMGKSISQLLAASEDKCHVWPFKL